jgi:hypothetical protein
LAKKINAGLLTKPQQPSEGGDDIYQWFCAGGWHSGRAAQALPTQQPNLVHTFKTSQY